MIRAALLALLAGAADAQPAEPVPEPAGYRMEAFRAPVPATLAGGTVLDTGAARALWEAGGAVFVDVLPQAPRPANLPEGTLWRDRPRETIPGATWLPNVGYGALAAETDAYFRAGLDAATGGDPARPVVFFCLADCWMSWNAAKRAIAEYGRSGVSWYPDGTDGWTAAGLATERVEPFAP